MFKRNLLPALIIALVIICSCDSKVNDDPAAWPVDPIEVFILISNEFGDNLLEDATDGNWSDSTFVCHFEGKTYQCDRTSVIDQDHVQDEDYFYGITISGIFYEETISIPVISFGAFSGKRQMDDDIVFDWPDGSEDTVHIQNTFYYNEKGYPITRRKIYINGEECTNLITLRKRPLFSPETDGE